MYLGARPSRGARARARARACARGPPRPVGVRQHEQSRKHSPLIYGSVRKYTSDTNERTTNEIPFNRKDDKILAAFKGS